MSAANRLLDRLHNVKTLRAGNYAAGCPCCQSKRGRPISVREIDDGRVLVYAFCGCELEAILGALGLALADLFDKPLDHHKSPVNTRIAARDILQAIDHEALSAVMVLDEIRAQRRVTSDQVERLTQAAAAIGRAMDAAHGR